MRRKTHEAEEKWGSDNGNKGRGGEGERQLVGGESGI